MTPELRSEGRMIECALRDVAEMIKVARDQMGVTIDAATVAQAMRDRRRIE
jgi:hypothetical protein